MKFKEYSFKDLLVDIVDNRGKTCPTAETGMPLIATNCIKNDALYPVFQKVRYVDDETYNNWFRGHPEPGDMIFVCKGSPGRVAWVPDPVNFCIAQDMVAIRADATKVYPKYLFALLRSEQAQQKIMNMHVGTLIPHFKKGDFGNLYFDIPEDLEYQKQVGDAYFSFCEKIEHNHQINQTLEQIAQAIFKSWFVDFEPVKAKIEAKQNGQDTERAAMRTISGKTDEELDLLSPDQYQQLTTAAALFPDELEDDAQGNASAAGGRMPGAVSELGEIPKGWAVKPLSQMIELIGGGTPKRSEDAYWGGEILWFSVKDAPADGDVFVIDTDEKITEQGLNKSSTKLLPEGVTIISARGTVGRLALIGVPMAMNQSCYGVKGANGVGDAFNYFNLKQAISTLKQQSHGAVFDTITTKTFDSVYSVNPCENSAKEFECVITSLLERIKSNLFETKSLVDCRDSLLLKLLTGEIPLKAA